MRIKIYLQVAIGATILIVEPLDATLLMEDVLTIGHDLDLLPRLERLETDRAVLIFLKNGTVVIPALFELRRLFLSFLFSRVFLIVAIFVI